MSKDIKAFPSKEYAATNDPDTIAEVHNYGMMLRDYFAAHASEDDIATYMPKTVGEVKLNQHHTRQWARYKHADAMMKAREQ